MSLFIFLTISTSFAKKKKAVEQTAEEPAAVEVDPTLDANVPSDGTSKKFAKKLLSTEFVNFDANITGLVWEQLTFSPDNTFTATASQYLMDESMSCVEKGSWTMDPASSSTVTNMTLNIESGDCPAADVPRKMRIQATINGTRIDAKYR